MFFFTLEAKIWDKMYVYLSKILLNEWFIDWFTDETDKTSLTSGPRDKLEIWQTYFLIKHISKTYISYNHLHGVIRSDFSIH